MNCSAELSQSLNVAWLLLSLTAAGFAKFPWHDLFHFEVLFFFSFISVSGSVIWDCHTAQEKKIKKQNLGERKWKTCPSVFLYLARGFFIIKVLGCKQMSAEPSPVQTCDRTGRRFVPSAAATHLAALCWGRCLRQRRKSVMSDQTCY